MALAYDATDQADIASATAAGGKIWMNPIIQRLKDKIKDSFLNGGFLQCCYCARLFHGEFRMVIDIEHVLPQQHFSTERFTIQNLHIACKRCNMIIKKADISFLVNRASMGTNYYQSANYKLVHPNLDTYVNHIVVKSIRSGNLVFIKYVLKDQLKAKYTYDYFLLKELEIDTINKAQGLKTVGGLSEKISSGVRKLILVALTKI